MITNAWPGFGAQKQFAVEQAKHEWIFSLDADERVSDELKQSIRVAAKRKKPNLQMVIRSRGALIISNAGFVAEAGIPIDSYDSSGRAKVTGKQRHIHESVTMNPGARVERLNGDLLHYTSQNAAHHHRMIGERYAPLAARQMFEEGRRTSVFGVASAGPAAFIRSLILKGGLRDGFAGFTIASFAAHHAFLKHLMLWEKQARITTDHTD